MSEPSPPRIVHVEALAVGVVLHLDRMALEEEVRELLFPAERFPRGPPSGAVLAQWKGRFEQYHLILSRDAWLQMSEEIRNLYVLPSLYSPAEVGRQREQDLRAEQARERWLDTYHPILGQTPRKALERPGWFVREDHYVWIGHDPHDFHGSIQWVPRDEVDAVEERLRYYLDKGMSLFDAMRHIESSDRETLKAIVIAAAGYDIGLDMLEEQARREAVIAQGPLVRELEADRIAVEAAIAEAVERLGRPPPAPQRAAD